MTVNRRRFNRIAQTERVEFIHIRIDRTDTVTLVDRKADRLFTAQQHGRNIHIRRGNTGFYIRHHNDHVRRFNGDLSLSAHKFQHFAVGIRLNASGIHNFKFSAVPVTRSVNSVTGNSRRILNNGSASARKFVKQHRLADVRTADDRYQRLCHTHCLLSSVSNMAYFRYCSYYYTFRKIIQPQKEKRKGSAFLVSLIHELFCLSGRKNLAAIVGTALLASSMGQTRFAALRAGNNAGHRELPMRATSLIPSRLGNLTLRNSHE